MNRISLLPTVLVGLATLFALPARGAEDDVLPILAWGGPPADETSPERYRELAECGFNYNFSGFGNADAMAKALDVAQQAGIKLMISCPELTSDPEGTAKRFKDHPANGGYYLRDEPPATLFPELATWAKRVQSVDPKNPCYINLFPNYATPEQLGSPSYAAHVDQFLRDVPVPILSFDHYPVVGNTLRGEWYQNLEIVSAAAKKADKPFWAFALAVAHGPYPVPTMAHLRVQMYSNLAYGARGLQYFTYWTFKSDTWDFHDAPILPDGKRSPVYDLVRDLNRELQAMRGVFVGSIVVSVAHTGDNIPAGTRKYEPAAPVQSLATQGQGAVVSQLSKGDRRFLVIVNRDINAAMPLDVAFAPAAKVAVMKKDGSPGDVVPNRAQIKVAPGDAVIFAWTQQ